MFKEITVRITSTEAKTSYFQIKFSAEAILDDGKEYNVKSDLNLEWTEMNEEIIKTKILQKVEQSIARQRDKEWTERLRDKVYRNEDFAFSKIFGKKDNGKT